MKYIGIIIATFVTINLSAQCYEDRHSTDITDGWMSCDRSANPHGVMGQSHWIRYDFGVRRDLHDIQLWNLTHPEYIKSGVKTVVVATSNNNSSWTIRDTITVPRAEYTSFHEGFKVGDLNGVRARYLLLTALDNHGGGCYGFSELRVYTQPVVEDELELDVAICENAGLHRGLTGGMGQGGVYSGPGVTDNGDDSFDFDADEVGPGIYTINYTYGPITLSDQIEVLACGDLRCPDCIDCNGYDQTDVDSPNIPSGKYHGDLVTAEGRVQATRDVNFRGSEEITLEGGFEVNANSEFLAEIRECYVNMLDNPGFESGQSGWTVWHTNPEVQLTHQISTVDPAEGTQCMEVDITQAHSTGNWRAQLSHGDLNIENGKTYRVSFQARSPDASGMILHMELDGDPWTTIFETFVPYKTYWETFSYTFTVDQDVPIPVRWSAHMGIYEGTHYIDNVKVVEIK